MKHKLSTNQAGIAHLMLIVVIVVLAGVGGVGYFVWSKQKDNSAGNTSLSSSEKKAIEVECKKEIDDKDFCKFASNVNFDEDFISTITTTGAEGNSVMTMESSGGNSRIVTNVNGNEVAAIVTLGNVSYVKNVTEGNWVKYTNEDDSTDGFSAESDLGFNVEEDIVNDNTKYEKVGKEACGDLQCFKYKITDPDEADSEQFIWFDDKEYKLRRFTFSNADGSSDVSYSYQKVNITEPSPVVEAPNYENMSAEELQNALEAAMQQ